MREYRKRKEAKQLEDQALALIQKRQVRDFLTAILIVIFSFMSENDELPLNHNSLEFKGSSRFPFLLFLLFSLSLYPSIYLSICLSICVSIYLSICVSIYLSIYLSIYVSIYLSVYLSIYLPMYSYTSLSLSFCLLVYFFVSLSPSHSLTLLPSLFFFRKLETKKKLVLTASDQEFFDILRMRRFWSLFSIFLLFYYCISP